MSTVRCAGMNLQCIEDASEATRCMGVVCSSDMRGSSYTVQGFWFCFHTQKSIDDAHIVVWVHVWHTDTHT